MGNFSQGILAFAQKSLKSQVWAKDASGTNNIPNAKGQCWDLAYEALRTAGAKTPVLIPATGSQLYVWGNKPGAIAKAQAGDILQFTNFKLEIWITEKDAQGAITFKLIKPKTVERGFPGKPHHTAILKSKGTAGMFDLYEQHWPSSKLPIEVVLTKDVILEPRTVIEKLEDGGTKETKYVISGSLAVYTPS